MGSHEQWLGTVFLLLAARTLTHTEPPTATGEETVYGPTGDLNRGTLAYRARTQTTELKSHTHRRPVTISICLIRFIPESTRNHAGTDETVHLLPAAQTWNTLSHKMSKRRKNCQSSLHRLRIELETLCMHIQISTSPL